MITIFTRYSGIDILIYGGAFILALMFAFGLHEWSHAYVAYKEGDSTAKALGRMSINPIVHLDLIGSIMLLLFGFGWAKPVPVNPFNFRNGRKSDLRVSLAGVGMNFAMTIVFGFLYVLSTLFITEDASIGLQFISVFLFYLTYIPFVLAIFNLLPIFPLDGYQALRALSKNPNNAFLNFMRQYGIWVLLILVVTDLFSYLISYLTAFILNPLLELYAIILGV